MQNSKIEVGHFFLVPSLKFCFFCGYVFAFRCFCCDPNFQWVSTALSEINWCYCSGMFHSNLRTVAYESNSIIRKKWAQFSQANSWHCAFTNAKMFAILFPYNISYNFDTQAFHRRNWAIVYFYSEWSSPTREFIALSSYHSDAFNA